MPGAGLRGAGESMERELGKVESVRLEIEDHGILSLSVGLVFRGSGQSFGGVALDTWDEDRKRRVGTAPGCDLILRLMELFGVTDLAAIRGRYVYALRAESRGLIVGLELPEPDGGKRLLLDDWRAEWADEFARLAAEHKRRRA